MAVEKYRVDGRKSHSYCSTVTVVVFAVLSLFGVWMLISSSVVPAQNSVLPAQKSTTELEKRTSKTDSRAFEDGPGDLPEDATKGEDSSESNESRSNSWSESTVDETSKENTKAKAEEENDGERKTEESELTSDGEKNSVNTEKSSEGKEENTVDTKHEDDSKTDEKIEEKQDQGLEEHSGENKSETQEKEKGSNEILPAGAQSEILEETNTTQNGHWSTQVSESENEKKLQKSALFSGDTEHKWKVCEVTAGPDYIPCLDNVKVIRKLPSTLHYEHRERHCPDVAPTCLVSLPDGYKQSIKWPKSREKIWYYNVPHPKLAEVKGHQNWVKVSGEYLTFPGGGTQFKNSALHYINFLQNSVPKLAWGKQTRVILDVGCGVASFGGYHFERDVLAMSFAPKNEHEAQVQFALERGIPALISVMGTKRLPYPSKVFDAIHCARCRVPLHIEGGKLLLELNRLLRPGGYFIWSATPVYRNNPEDSGIWTGMYPLRHAFTKFQCTQRSVHLNDQKNGH